jgi:hypothetical protein
VGDVSGDFFVTPFTAAHKTPALVVIDGFYAAAVQLVRVQRTELVQVTHQLEQ